MARAYGVTHKCLMPIAGQSMLSRVVDALNSTGRFDPIVVSIEDAGLLRLAFNRVPGNVIYAPSRESAAQSAIHALSLGNFAYPTLITTADHPLLTGEIVEHFIAQCSAMGADLLVAMAAKSVIQSGYPETLRTYLKFASDHVSGCNLFALMNPTALSALEHWRFVEQNRKRPWRLVGSFGAAPLLRYALGRLSLADAFAAASKSLRLHIQPVLMPFAEAAIDVDKPEDLVLVEHILRRKETTSRKPFAGPAASPPDNPLRTTETD